MTRASGRKAHSHGADFEKYLEDVVFKAALDSGYFARVDKQNPTYFATRSRAGVTFKPRAASGADWIALGGPECLWHYAAIEAKYSDDVTLARSRIKPHQAAHLDAAAAAGQLAVLIVSFASSDGPFHYAVRWSEELFRRRGNGCSLAIWDCSGRDELTLTRGLADVLGSWPKLP